MGKKIRIFFVCFIILVLFSGALFFIGWTQFRVKADTAGVLVSKTGGVNENVIEGREFSWHWEFLLPTNAQLRLFSTKPVMVEKKEQPAMGMAITSMILAIVSHVLGGGLPLSIIALALAVTAQKKGNTTGFAGDHSHDSSSLWKFRYTAIAASLGSRRSSSRRDA